MFHKTEQQLGHCSHDSSYFNLTHKKT